MEKKIGSMSILKKHRKTNLNLNTEIKVKPLTYTGYYSYCVLYIIYSGEEDQIFPFITSESVA